MNDKYARIIQFACSQPWALLPAKLEEIAEFLALKAEGYQLSEEEVQARIGSGKRAATRTAGGVGVLPVHGVISHRMNLMSDISGGTSIERLTQQYREMLDNPAVGTIVLDIDSPGGSVSGVDELSAEIYNGRKKKKTIAVANSMAASAAYYIGSAASEFVVIPSGDVGSIGVYMMHRDVSQAYEAMGVKTTFIKAGKYKAEGNPFEPLSLEAREAMQSDVDAHYEMFVKAVARNRGVSQKEVRDNYGEGRTLMAQRALNAGMVDRVATLDQVLADLGAPAMGRMSAEAEKPEVFANEPAGNNLKLRLRRLSI
jgi:signal peptide peptidase SppA